MRLPLFLRGVKKMAKTEKTDEKTTSSKTETKAQNVLKKDDLVSDDKEVKKSGKAVKIRALVRIRADFGAFDKGLLYEVSSETAERLISSGRAQKAE